MEGKNKETKITSVEKEGAKDPRRVEQEKKPGGHFQGGEGAQGEGATAARDRVQVRVFQSSIHSDHSRDRSHPRWILPLSPLPSR